LPACIFFNSPKATIGYRMFILLLPTTVSLSLLQK